MVKLSVKVPDNVKEYYNQIKTSKIQGFKFMIKDSVCVAAETSVLPADHSTPFQTLVCSNLEDSQPCFIAVNIRYRDEERKLVQKVMLFVWCSDNANIKQRMLFASSLTGILNSLGVHTSSVVEIHDPEGQSIDSVFSKIIGPRAKPTNFEKRLVAFNNDNRTYEFADV